MSMAKNSECFAFILKIMYKLKKKKTMVFVRKKNPTV